MKQVLLIVSVIVLLSSCDLTYIEDAYDSRDNFTGRFEAEEYSETYDQLSFFDTRILKDSDDYGNVIYIRNFYAVDIEVFAEVNGNRVTIPRQSNDGYIIEGTGRYENGAIYLTYAVEDTFSANGRTDFCNTVLIRN